MYLLPEQGMTIRRFCEYLLEVNKVVEVTGIFNDKYISVNKEDTVETLIDRYAEMAWADLRKSPVEEIN